MHLDLTFWVFFMVIVVTGVKMFCKVWIAHEHVAGVYVVFGIMEFTLLCIVNEAGCNLMLARVDVTSGLSMTLVKFEAFLFSMFDFYVKVYVPPRKGIYDYFLLVVVLRLFVPFNCWCGYLTL